jgi:hypothetical protein
MRRESTDGGSQQRRDASASHAHSPAESRSSVQRPCRRRMWLAMVDAAQRSSGEAWRRCQQEARHTAEVCNDAHLTRSVRRRTSRAAQESGHRCRESRCGERHAPRSGKRAERCGSCPARLRHDGVPSSRPCVATNPAGPEIEADSDGAHKTVQGAHKPVHPADPCRVA